MYIYFCNQKYYNPGIQFLNRVVEDICCRSGECYSTYPQYIKSRSMEIALNDLVSACKLFFEQATDLNMEQNEVQALILLLLARI